MTYLSARPGFAVIRSHTPVGERATPFLPFAVKGSRGRSRVCGPDVERPTLQIIIWRNSNAPRRIRTMHSIHARI